MNIKNRVRLIVYSPRRRERKIELLMDLIREHRDDVYVKTRKAFAPED